MKKTAITLILLLGVSGTGLACPFCNDKVMDGIYNSQFYPSLFTLLSAFIVLAVIVAVLTTISAKRHKARLVSNPNVATLSPVPLTTAAMVLGIGMGGFVDGIVFHQILQLHGMLSNKIPATEYIGKSVNMFWDGIFHFFCLLVVLTGIVLMWNLLFKKDLDRSGKLLAGGLLLGWGSFNIVEGVINHQILKLHNVIELSLNHNIGNFVFLGVSVAMLILGYVIVYNRNKSSYRTTDDGRQNGMWPEREKHLPSYDKVV